MTEPNSPTPFSSYPIERKQRWVWLELTLSIGFSLIAIWFILKSWPDSSVVQNSLKLSAGLFFCWTSGSTAGRYISLTFAPVDYWISPEGIGLRRGLIGAKTVTAARLACLLVTASALICPLLIILTF